MALRWLVRNDGIVDLGVWDVIKPGQLYIPLDVHVANVSRLLGLLTRRSNDRKAVLELTGRLRQMRPDDPVFYDYAHRRHLPHSRHRVKLHGQTVHRASDGQIHLDVRRPVDKKQ